MPKIRDERGLPRENTAVSRQRGGKPSMDVPGDGAITKPVGPISNRSAANYADPMKPLGGSGGTDHKYKKNR